MSSAGSTEVIDDFVKELNKRIGEYTGRIKKTLEELKEIVESYVDNIDRTEDSSARDCISTCNKKEGTCKCCFILFSRSISSK